MSRYTAVAIIAGVLLVAGVVAFVASRGDDDTFPEAPQPMVGPEDLFDTTAETVLVDLYFPDEGGQLSAEARELVAWSVDERGAEAVLRAVLAGPETPGLSAPLPPEASLGPLHLTPDGVLYVDLISTQLSRPPSGGSQTEILTIWSLVDTVTLAIPTIESVVLLWNGRQLPSFGGHVDTSQPLRADRDLIRTRR